MRLLAIDDNADNLVSLVALLRAYLPGCVTATASSGPEGLALSRTFHPDVILLDIQMPDMDGYEVCRTLRASPEDGHVPVIFLTAHGTSPASRIRALECGGDAFLSKPVEAGELMAQVRAMYRVRKAEDALRGEKRALEQTVAAGIAALGESQHLLAAVVGGTPDDVWVKDRGGRFLLANAAALLTLGHPASEVLGHTLGEIVGSATHASFDEADRRVLDSGETSIQLQPLTLAGQDRTFMTTRGPLRDATGLVTGVFGISRDFTEIARARLVLEKETERVQALLALHRVPWRSSGDVLRAAAEGLTTLTGSQAGLIGLPAEGGVQMLAHAWSAATPAPAGAQAFHLAFDQGGAWSDAIRNSRAAVLEGAEAARRGAFPAGYPAVRRLQVVPVVREGRVVLVGGVANRDQPYGEFDVNQAGLYLEGAWEAIQKALSEERRATQEELLRQAAKMEAVGRLAGGVAHDFNNLLAVILSYANFAVDTVGSSHPVQKDLLEIIRASERAAVLTRQLLAHSRRQVLQGATLDLGKVVAGIEPMLRRLLREDLDLRLQLAEGLWPVEADQGQLEQVIVNLAVNACDAMPRSGRLTIRTANLEAGSHPGPGTWVGQGVLLEVSDNGVGMDEATRARAFEPFYTTKERGKGTGLGLATVYGIVKQSGGDVHIESKLGAGTTFSIVLPRAAAERAPAAPAQRAIAPRRSVEAPPPGAGAILVVEDEDTVRALVERMLVEAGYRVITASNGQEALVQFSRHGQEVTLLLTDVVMPHLNGPELATRLSALRPGLRVLYMSGYVDDVLGQHGILAADTRFIGKPFTAEELVGRVREALAQEETGAATQAR